MSFDEGLAARVRKLVGRARGVEERRMFGGLAFLQSGKMFCGVLGRDLVVRVGPERHVEALTRPHTRPMDFTGRPMKGYIYVSEKGTADQRALASWVKVARRFVSTLA
jgi:TfoX/Sxy family transcriptional regulator of competence genes